MSRALDAKIAIEEFEFTSIEVYGKNNYSTGFCPIFPIGEYIGRYYGEWMIIPHFSTDNEIYQKFKKECSPQEVTIELIRTMRKLTYNPVWACKRALVDCEGNIRKATDLLRHNSCYGTWGHAR